MVIPTFLTTKKIFYYNFFPTKAEEEAQMARAATTGEPKKYDRVLIEIRDIYPPPKPSDSEWPWYITKTIGHYDQAYGRIPLTFIETFQHVMRYWDMREALMVTDGCKVGVTLWDVTDQSSHKKYHGDDAFLKMMPNDDFVLFCPENMKAEKLRVGNKLALCWDVKESAFLFKVL